jgi:hypothetical protein
VEDLEIAEKRNAFENFAGKNSKLHAIIYLTVPDELNLDIEVHCAGAANGVKADK